MKSRQLNNQSNSVWLNRCKRLLPILLLVYIPITSLLILIKLQTTIPIGHLTKDVVAVLQQPFYLGIVSNLGILLWCSAAAICFFSFAILRTDSEHRVLKSYLLFSGLLTSFILLDDLLLLHEEVLPIYLGIPEKVVYLGYAMIISLYFICFRKVIMKTEFIPLLFALGWLGFSVLVDAVKEFLPPSLGQREGIILLEDGAKLLGIASWLVYYTMVCIKQVKLARFLLTEVSHQESHLQSKAVR